MTQTWQETFRKQDQIRLALAVRERGAFAAGHSVRVLADDRVVLLGGAREAARLSKRPTKEPQTPHCVILTPESEQSAGDYAAELAKARKSYPQAELAGFGPQGFVDHEGHLDRVVLKLGTASVDGFEEDPEWKNQAVSQDVRLTLVLVYSPDVSPESLEQAVEACRSVSNLTSVVALPLGAGDRIPLKGLTTAGTTDAMVLSALRLLLPSQVWLRASWAALGWKVAQLCLAYGANELAGWTAAETAVYTGRVRAAARVEDDEVECGLAEVGCPRVDWNQAVLGVTR